MTLQKATLLGMLPPSTRKTLVAERIAAMRGRVVEVCSRLRSLIATTPPVEHAELAAVGSLLSDILHTDGHVAESLVIFKENVEPHLRALPEAVQLAAGDNFSELQMRDSPDEGVSTFYHSVDRHRLAHQDASADASLVAAYSEIERRRFTEALPRLWRSYRRAYESGSWRETRWAAERLLHFNLKIGALEQACHYLLMAEADKVTEELASAVSKRNDPSIVHAVVSRIMSFGNLKRHFIVGCKIIAGIPDSIPDADVEPLAKWLHPRCRELAEDNGGGVMLAAWQALLEIGHRISEETSQKLIETALSHPEWLAPQPGEGRVLPYRKCVIEAVSHLSHSAPKDLLEKVVQETLPLATDRAQDYDYGEVVNLLCNLSELGGEAVQARVKAALYVPGKPLNRILLQVAEFFGVEAIDSPQWHEFANKVIEEVRSTVQRIKPGAFPKPVGETLMAMTHTAPEGQLQISMQGSVGLHALVRGRRHLSEDAIERVILAILEMSTNSDNFLSNRETLLSLCCDLADSAGPELRDKVVRELEPLARGSISESDAYPKSASARNPLAQTVFNMGTPEDVQATALVAAASFCGSDAARSRLIVDALAEGFVNSNASVRRGAYAAARRLPTLSAEQLLPVLMGLRDPDPEAAVAAFAAFTEREEWSLSRPMWKLFLLATKLARTIPERETPETRRASDPREACIYAHGIHQNRWTRSARNSYQRCI